MIGIELGADVSANVDLDEFMVFEQNEDRARSFFLGLLFKHITAGHEGEPDPAVAAIERARVPARSLYGPVAGCAEPAAGPRSGHPPCQAGQRPLEVLVRILSK
jgi:hypothetical protein